MPRLFVQGAEGRASAGDAITPSSSPCRSHAASVVVPGGRSLLHGPARRASGHDRDLGRDPALASGMKRRRDRELGMDRRITRRDFLNGVALGVGGAPRGAATSPPRRFAGLRPQNAPPATTRRPSPGCAASNEGSYAVGHALQGRGVLGERAGAPSRTPASATTSWSSAAGSSGLSAAWFCRRRPARRRASWSSRTTTTSAATPSATSSATATGSLLGYGGTQSIERPSRYSTVAAGLLRELGIEHAALLHGLRPEALRLDGARDRRLLRQGDASAPIASWPASARGPLAELLAETPLSRAGSPRHRAPLHGEADYLPGLTPREKREAAREDELRRLPDPDRRGEPEGRAAVLPDAHPRPLGPGHRRGPGARVRARPATTTASATPASHGLGLAAGTPRATTSPTSSTSPTATPRSHGCWCVRLMPGDGSRARTMEDIVTARADYARLDEAASAVRIRLNSTVVRVEAHAATGAATARGRGRLRPRREAARRVRRAALRPRVLERHHPVPLRPSCPRPRRKRSPTASRCRSSTPTSLIRNWTSFQTLRRSADQRARQLSLVGGARLPREPRQLPLPEPPRGADGAVPAAHAVQPGPAGARAAPRRPHRAALHDVRDASSGSIRDQLGRMLSGGGFDPARDIEAITVNRWSHGYAYWYNSLFDPDWPADQRPWVVGRKLFGRIAIANSDAEANAYTQAAIDRRTAPCRNCSSAREPHAGRAAPVSHRVRGLRLLLPGW